MLMNAADDDLRTEPIGQVLDGKYRVTRLIGQGGMGRIFEAVQLRLNRRVALKLMSSDLATNAQALARFRREAEVTSQLGHPHIVQLLDSGVTASGEPYMAMEFLDGEDLDARVRREGRLPLDTVVQIVKQAASALGATHAKGITHRDLKPANIFLVRLDGEDFVKVVDFGISKVRAAATRLTRGGAMGTPQFMSPEQAAGKLDQIDHRTDQWALACIAFEALTGQPPFVGDDVAPLLYQVMQDTPPTLSSLEPNLPPALDAVMMRALAKDRRAALGEHHRVCPGLRACGRVARGPYQWRVRGADRGRSAGRGQRQRAWCPRRSSDRLRGEPLGASRAPGHGRATPHLDRRCPHRLHQRAWRAGGTNQRLDPAASRPSAAPVDRCSGSGGGGAGRDRHPGRAAQLSSRPGAQRWTGTARGRASRARAGERAGDRGRARWPFSAPGWPRRRGKFGRPRGSAACRAGETAGPAYQGADEAIVPAHRGAVRMYTALAVVLTVVMQLQQPALAAPAPHPGAKSKAQALLREGTKLYRAKLFQAALDRFSEAYRLYPSPKLQFNIAQANRDLGRPVEALLAFEAFLAGAGAGAGANARAGDATAAARAEARASVSDLQAQLGRIQVRTDRLDLEVLLDGEVAGRTPLPAPLWVTPGAHFVALRGDGLAPESKTVTVAAGGLRTVQLAPRPIVLSPRAVAASPATPAPAHDQPTAGGQWYRRWWVWALAGTAVAVGGGAVVASRSGGTPMPSTSLGTQKVFR